MDHIQCSCDFFLCKCSPCSRTIHYIVLKCPIQKIVSKKIRRGWSPLAGEDNKKFRGYKVKKGTGDGPTSITPGVQKSEFCIFGHSIRKTVLLQVLALTCWSEHGWFAFLHGSFTSTVFPWSPSHIPSPSFLGFHTDSSSSARYWNSSSSGALSFLRTHLFFPYTFVARSGGYHLLHDFS